MIIDEMHGGANHDQNRPQLADGDQADVEENEPDDGDDDDDATIATPIMSTGQSVRRNERNSNACGRTFVLTSPFARTAR